MPVSCHSRRSKRQSRSELLGKKLVHQDRRAQWQACRLSYLASVTLSGLCNNVDGRPCRIAHDVDELALCRAVSKARMGVIEYEV